MQGLNRLNFDSCRFAHFDAESSTTPSNSTLLEESAMLKSMRWQKSEQFYWSDDEEDGLPPIIVGPVYTDVDVLQLDLFHRAHSLRNSGNNKSLSGAFAKGHLNAADDSSDLPSELPVLSNSKDGSSSAPKKTPGKNKMAKTRKSQLVNLLSGITGRRKIAEPINANKTIESDVRSQAWHEVPQLHDWQTCPSFANESLL